MKRSVFSAAVFFLAAVSSVSVLAGWPGSVETGEWGVWRLEWEDGTFLSERDWDKASDNGWTFDETWKGRAVHRRWRSPELDVTVSVTPSPDEKANDYRISVSNRSGKAVAGCAFPARLRFPAHRVKRFVYPGRGNYGLGMAFNAKFFQPTGDATKPYLSYRVKYPSLFADFALLETVEGACVAVYGLQPRQAHEPWQNPCPFTPGETAVGGDERGGWYDHAFATWVKKGRAWTSPVVRIRTGATLEAALADYAAANGFTKTLAEKVGSDALLNKLKEAPLFFIQTGTAETLKALLDDIPAPTLIHLSNYLKGGFDKEYPDHLPPNKRFGTQEDFRSFVDALHAKGHLFCPYTNPTWWGDKPKGPTFQKWGMEAISVGRDGKPRYEIYGPNEGWQQTYFHPGSHEGNRRTIRQFVEEIPADLLFEDQCGGRNWVWDFNPASPSPTAHTEGMVSLVQEHARSLPVATEDGWDHLANFETALMGCTWRIVPFSDRSAPSRLSLFKKKTFPADTWEIEPVALRLFHDKCLFYLHNLSAGVSGEMEIPWLLGLGFQMSYMRFVAECEAGDVARPDWYRYLHLLQTKVVSKIAGQPLVSFKHDRGPLLASGGAMGRETDDGTLEAQYGPVKVWANLGDVPRTVGGRQLAPYGYYVEGPGVVASKLEGQDPIVRADGEIYTYETRLLPPACETVPQQPAAAAGDAPTVGILDMTVMGSSSATTSPDAWERVLAQSAFGMRTKARIRRLRSYEELETALKGMPTKFLAIINPYGEAYPTAGAGSWRETMEAIRRYVLAGGNWIETGGFAFYVARWQGADGRVRHEKTKCAAQAMLGTAQCLFAFSSEMLRPKRVRPSRDGEMILSPETREQIATTQTRVDRALERGVDPVLPLVVDAEDRIWFGGNRLGGVGALWRTGGKDPDARLLQAVICDMLLHQWVTCPTPPPARRARCLVKTHP